MSGYTLHPEAFQDVDEIREHIAEDNPDAADRVVTEIFETIQGLVSFPHRGFRRADLSSHEVRFTLAGPYIIAYAADVMPLRILAVVHGRRSPRVVAAILRDRK